ncbi:hypothetical protein B566_EDAN002587 [Ephemera danica]|nr:hypothetical protein B566_EDAN002587 [Ephemera danica]
MPSMKISLLLLSALCFVFALGQNQQSATTPRSYAQAANRNQQQQPSQQNTQSFVHQDPVASNNPTNAPSYAQAANRNQQGSQTFVHQDSPPLPSNPTNAPSYAQAANRNQQGSQTFVHQDLPPLPSSPTPPSYAQAANRNQQPSVTTPSNRAQVHQNQRTGSTPSRPTQASGRPASASSVTDDDLLQARDIQGATVSKLRALYDNYDRDTSHAEQVTPEETAENAAFLDAVMATQVMAKTRNFLTQKNLLTNEPGSLRALLLKLWFTMFPRAGGRSEIGSSSFEHVFMGEVHRGEVSGFHNWVFFHNEEKAGRANYRGFNRYVDLGGRGSVVKYSFTWANHTKPVNSMFIATSPELEMALYTVCFLARPGDRCPVRLSGQPFHIKTYPFTYHGSQYIGSAFPEI